MKQIGNSTLWVENTMKLICYLHCFVTWKKKVKIMYIYMEPLIDDLLKLYDTRVLAFDVLEPVGREKFIVRVALLWTIHDWPGQ
jgi:hypothetical protein